MLLFSNSYIVPANDLRVRQKPTKSYQHSLLACASSHSIRLITMIFAIHLLPTLHGTISYSTTLFSHSTTHNISINAYNSLTLIVTLFTCVGNYFNSHTNIPWGRIWVKIKFLTCLNHFKMWHATLKVWWWNSVCIQWKLRLLLFL